MFRRRKTEPGPPIQDEVVDRVLCVAVTTMLGAVVTNRREGALDEEKAEQYAAESHRWLRRENLADALTVGERALVAKSPGDWSEPESVGADWRNESVGVLLWAISAIAEMPRPGHALRASDVARAAARADGRVPPAREPAAGRGARGRARRGVSRPRRRRARRCRGDRQGAAARTQLALWRFPGLGPRLRRHLSPARAGGVSPGLRPA